MCACVCVCAQRARARLWETAIPVGNVSGQYHVRYCILLQAGGARRAQQPAAVSTGSERLELALRAQLLEVGHDGGVAVAARAPESGGTMRGVKHEFGMLFTHEGGLTPTLERQTTEAGSSKYWEIGGNRRRREGLDGPAC